MTPAAVRASNGARPGTVVAAEPVDDTNVGLWTTAAILAAILYQRCDYEILRDVNTANRILDILTQDEYIDLLKIYVKVFKNDRKNSRLEHLREFLDYAGFDINKLT